MTAGLCCGYYYVSSFSVRSVISPDTHSDPSCLHHQPLWSWLLSSLPTCLRSQHHCPSIACCSSDSAAELIPSRVFSFTSAPPPTPFYSLHGAVTKLRTLFLLSTWFTTILYPRSLFVNYGAVHYYRLFFVFICFFLLG